MSRYLSLLHPRSLNSFLARERWFLFIIATIFGVTIIFKDQPAIVMWVGFFVAGYSSTANDSIQTLGTFIASNKKTQWWILWIFIGGIMIVTLSYSWITYGGDTAYGRLTHIPQVEQFHILQLIAPIILLILTRYKIPVSTTFLLLATFSSSKTIQAMLNKTLIGYFMAFFVALIIWALVSQLIKNKYVFTKHYNKQKWRAIQWTSTAYLWSTWLMQDHSNTVVFLPRVLSGGQFVMVISFLFLIMGILFYLRGGSIQHVITEKTDVVDVRSATIIDFVYGSILLVFKQWNSIPMSTTWVFLGLLAGREVSLARLTGHEKPYTRTLYLVMKDLAFAAIGLAVSLLIAWGTQLYFYYS